MMECPGVNISESGEKITPSNRGIRGKESGKGDDPDHQARYQRTTRMMGKDSHCRIVTEESIRNHAVTWELLEFSVLH